MTVPAVSVSSVPPGAPIPSTGTVAGLSAGGGLFESLLAGFGEAGGGGKAAKAGPVADPAADATAQDPTGGTPDGSLAMMLFGPAPTPSPAAGADGEAATAESSRGMRGGAFSADWRSPAVVLAAAGDDLPPDVADGTADGAATAIADALRSDAAARPDDQTSRGAAGAAQTLPADPKAQAAATTLSSARSAPADSRPVTPDVAQAAAPQPAAPPPTPASTAAIPPAAAAAAAGTLVAATATPAPSAHGAPSDAETRRTGGARGERRSDAVGRVGATPSVQASLRAAALTPAQESPTVATDGGPDASPAVDPAEPEPAAADAGAPTLPAELRAQAAQATVAPVETAPPRSTPETVARLAADIVRKADGKSTRFDLQLDPHGLGKVDVALEIDRNGKLTAALSFDSAQSAADLRGRAGELRQALEQAGFDIAEGGLTFDLSGQGAGFSGREAGQHQDRAWNGRAFQRAQIGAEEADLSLASTPSLLSNRTRSGVDIRI